MADSDQDPADNDLVGLIDALLAEMAVQMISGLPETLREMRASASSAEASASARDTFLTSLSRLLFSYRLQREMSRLNIPFPVYNYLEDFGSNELLPWAPPLKERPVVIDRTWRLLGRDIGLPIGIPASILTVNAEWVGYHARNGFNVLTYKTVRTKARPPLEKPNWLFISEPSEPISVEHRRNIHAFGGPDVYPVNSERFSTANSFGVPSESPDVWRPDVEEALSRLAPDQLLILSVMGTYESLSGPALVEDFVDGAVLGASTGVRAVEINVSCPNGVNPKTGQVLSPICEDPTAVIQIVTEVRRALDPTVALIVKFGYLDATPLRAILQKIGHIIDAVSGINTWQVPVSLVGDEDKWAFVNREQAGLSGHVLHDLALDFVQNAALIRSEIGASYDIIGMGGVMTPADAVTMYNAGASAVQTATAAFFDHRFAHRVIAEFGSSFPQHAPLDLVDVGLAESTMIKLLEEQRKATVAQLSARTAYAPSVVTTVLNRLVSQHRVQRATEGTGFADIFVLAHK